VTHPAYMWLCSTKFRKCLASTEHGSCITFKYSLRTNQIHYYLNKCWTLEGFSWAITLSTWLHVHMYSLLGEKKKKRRARTKLLPV
jgi:hypothetical protein